VIEPKLPAEYALLCDAGKILFWHFYLAGETLWLNVEDSHGFMALPCYDARDRRDQQSNDDWNYRVPIFPHGNYWLMPERLCGFVIVHPGNPAAAY
jgi:hypothetical protein